MACPVPTPPEDHYAPQLTLVAGLVSSCRSRRGGRQSPQCCNDRPLRRRTCLTSIGTLAFGPNGVLYAADPQSATIYAIDLGASARREPPAPRTSPASISRSRRCSARQQARSRSMISPSTARTKNSYLAVMRGMGAMRKPVLLRVDGAGKIEIVNTETLKFTSIALPNPGRRQSRCDARQPAHAVGDGHGVRERQALRRRTLQ
jgi:hypothetical protein